MWEVTWVGVWKWKTTSIMQERFPRCWEHARKGYCLKNMVAAWLWLGGMGGWKGRCVYLFLEWSTWHDWNSNGVMAIDMQARLRLKHFSALTLTLRARPTKLKSRVKQTVAHCAVIKSNEAMGTVSPTQPSQPSRPLAVAKSRSSRWQRCSCLPKGGRSGHRGREAGLVCVRLHLPSKRRLF